MKKLYAVGIDYTHREGLLTTYTVDEYLLEDNAHMEIHHGKIEIHGDAELREEILRLLNKQPQQLEAKIKEHQAWLHRLEKDIKTLRGNAAPFPPLR